MNKNAKLRLLKLLKEYKYELGQKLVYPNVYKLSYYDYAPNEEQSIKSLINYGRDMLVQVIQDLNTKSLLYSRNIRKLFTEKRVKQNQLTIYAYDITTWMGYGFGFIVEDIGDSKRKLYQSILYAISSCISKEINNLPKRQQELIDSKQEELKELLCSAYPKLRAFDYEAEAIVIYDIKRNRGTKDELYTVKVEYKFKSKLLPGGKFQKQYIREGLSKNQTKAFIEQYLYKNVYSIFETMGNNFMVYYNSFIKLLESKGVYNG